TGVWGTGRISLCSDADLILKPAESASTCPASAGDRRRSSISLEIKLYQSIKGHSGDRRAGATSASGAPTSRLPDVKPPCSNLAGIFDPGDFLFVAERIIRGSLKSA